MQNAELKANSDFCILRSKFELNGWAGRIRTFEWRLQRPLPYRLATAQHVGEFYCKSRVLAMRHLAGAHGDFNCSNPLCPFGRLPLHEVEKAKAQHSGVI